MTNPLAHTLMVLAPHPTSQKRVDQLGRRASAWTVSLFLVLVPPGGAPRPCRACLDCGGYRGSELRLQQSNN